MATTIKLILNVDHDEGARHSNTHALMKAGFEVIEASDITQALKCLQRNPDLLLLGSLPSTEQVTMINKALGQTPPPALLSCGPELLNDLTNDHIQTKQLPSGFTEAQLIAEVQSTFAVHQTSSANDHPLCFRQIADHSDDVLWVHALPSGTLEYASPSFRQIWNADADPAAWLSAVFPEDRERVQQNYEQLLALQPYTEEYRLVAADKQIKWVRERGFIAPDAAGKLSYAMRSTRDITLIKRAENSLADAEKYKDEFLATLAHELRSPLGPIHNAIEMLQAADTGNNKERAYAHEVLSRQVDQMAHLVDDLLDIARISRGQISLEKTVIDLNKLVQSAADAAVAIMRQRDHTFQVTLPPSKVWVSGDPVRLAQVVGNLLNNAAKYTPRGGRIHLLVETTGNKQVRITVRDNGIGISADRADKIFNLFVQGDAAPDVVQNGLGIGLSLVRQLVELHGGSVKLESAGVGAGSSFFVTLPIAEVEVNALETDGDSSSADQGRESRLILIVDDNADAAETTAMLLDMYGHSTHLASDAISAMAMAHAHHPEVILLDIGLPGKDGYEVARMLRKEPQFQKTKLIAITGYGSDSDREKAMQAGFNHHLVKPTNWERLLGLLKTA